MNIGSQKSTFSRAFQHQIAALSLFTLAGMVVGVGATNTQADQDPQLNGSRVAIEPQQPKTSSEAKYLEAKIGFESGVRYLVERPSWRSSKAIITPDRNIPTRTIEHTLYSQILVGVENEAQLKTAIKQVAQAMGFDRPGANTYSRYLDDSKIFVVEVGSVEQAINLANEITNFQGVEWAEVVHSTPTKAMALTADPSARNQWHITNPYIPGNDHKIEAVHDSGVTGAGVIVGILEFGGNAFYHTPEGGDPTVPADRDIHPDLANQLNFELSQPTYMFDKGYSHGVSVAGIVAAEANNGLAGSGVAYGAQLANLRFGNSMVNGIAFSHEINNIHIVNNSWGPDNESFPNLITGKYLVAGSDDDFEIDIPQVTSAGIARAELIGLDRGIRLGRGGKGRVFLFSAGNSSHFTGFPRLGIGNAISLPGIGPIDPALPAAVAPYGYIDLSAVDATDNLNVLGTPGSAPDGIPDAFLEDGALGILSRHSGTIGGRVEYNGRASLSRTLAIGSAGMRNNISGYSTTGTGVIASAYAQENVINTEFTPAPNPGWGAASFGLGISTLEQIDGEDGGDPIDCNTATLDAFSLIDNYALTGGLIDGETCLFNGTSAASPVAAGIIALMLETNPDLTIRDIQHIIQQTSTVVNYDSNASYWPSVILGLGQLDDDDDPNNPTPTFWSTNSADVRHSDEFGFGILNAEAAVAAAANWTPVGTLNVLTTGNVELEEPAEVEDATFEFMYEANENLNVNRLVPGTELTYELACVRENYRVEGVEIALTFQGEGVGDLLLALRSPYGTISPIALPRGDDGTYQNFTFTTYKNWGELSGGQWELVMQDYRPNEESPEGTPKAVPFDPTDLGLEEFTYLGPFGMPGNPDHDELTLVEYQLRIFSTDEGLAPSEGCPVFNTSCPADLDGNGIIEVADIRMFIFWFVSGDPLADLNGDGVITFGDMNIYQAIWIPGFCDADDPRGVGGRPVQGGGITRPIGVLPGN